MMRASLKPVFHSIVIAASAFALARPAHRATGAETPAPASATADPKPLVPKGELEGFKLSWSDEFDGEKLDAGKWTYRLGPRMWSESTKENVSVHGGLLRIALKKQDINGKHYTAGGIISKQTFKHGYFEARFKMPPGAGWHTSFWTAYNGGEPTPSGARQEVDICEQDSVNPNAYSTNVHQWAPKHVALGAQHVKTPSLSDEFHVYGCLVTDKAARFFFDGKEVNQRDISHLKLDATNIWLTSIASNLGHTKEVDDSKLPAYAEFDYVRYYERK